MNQDLTKGPVMRSMLRFAVPMILGIWWSVPIGWFLADAVGILYYIIRRKKLLIYNER